MTADESPDLSAIVRSALAEDIGSGDVTTAATVPPEACGRARIISRAPGIFAGGAAVAETYREVDPTLDVVPLEPDGTTLFRSAVVAEIVGSFASLLMAERTALNFAQRLSGIATSTRAFVDAVAHTSAAIVDTRKTTPGWRALEKAAVVAGGGLNHRMGLYDAFLVKENHISAAGGITAALEGVSRANTAGLPVEVEVRTLEELDAALDSSPRPDRIMCDNFDLVALQSAVARIRKADKGIVIEASGGVRLDTVRAVAETGVDWISVGAITHSAEALDLSCLIDRE